MKTKLQIGLVAAALLAVGCSETQTHTKKESVQPAAETPAQLSPNEIASRGRLEADVRFLADDRLKGRLTPSAELDEAAEYLAKQVEKAGFAPASPAGFRQRYPLDVMRPDNTRFSITLNGIELAEEDYLFLAVGMGADDYGKEHSMDVVFAGYGIAMASKGADDYAGFDVKGRAVVALAGAPWETNPAVCHMPDRACGKGLQASLREAGMFIYVTEDLEKPVHPAPNPEIALLREISRMPLTTIDAPTEVFAPQLVITPRAFDKALAEKAGGTYEQWVQRLASEKFAPIELAAKLTYQVDATLERAESSNVVALLPGSDPKLADEWVLLMAHYDHVGTVAKPEGQDEICNGADDNASGTAAVLEVARLLAARGPFKRSVAVVLTSGEESGAVGSGFFSAHSPVPLDKVVLAFDVDMVGRSDGKVFCRTLDNAQLYDLAKQLGARHQLQVEPDPLKDLMLVYFTDAWSLVKHGIPVVDFFTNFHADYHQPSDEADKIRFDELTRITMLILDMVDQYARGNDRPAYEKPAWFVIPEGSL